jgi:PAS domain S-box-containing protein
MKKTKSNPDPAPLRVLILEDNPVDAELVVHELRRAKIDFTSRLVEEKREFNKALAEFQPLVILSDFNLPLFDGQAALEIARARAPEIPFIFVSGSIGEEKAIELLSQGASDYIFKDNLQRLGPAIKRAVENARLLLEKKKTDEELRSHVDELRLLAEAADRFVHINDLDKIYDYLARTIRDISGADYLLLSLFDEKLQAVRPKIVMGFEPFRETLRRRFHIDPLQMVFFLKDMPADDFRDFVSRRLLPVCDGLYGLANHKVSRRLCRTIEKLLAIDTIFTMGFSWENQLFGGVTVFFKKGSTLKNALQIEALVNLAAVAIKRLLAEKSLRESEERFRRVSATISDISYSCLTDEQGHYSLSWLTGAVDRITGYSNKELTDMKCWGPLVLAEDQADFEKNVTGLIAGSSGNCELRLRHKNGNAIWVQSFAECIQDSERPGRAILYGGLVDISGRKEIFEKLRQSEEYYRTLVETSPDAIIIVDAGGRVTFASEKTPELFGLPAQTSIKGLSILDFVEPAEIPRVQERMVEILSGRSLPEVREYRLQRQDRRSFWGEVSSAPLQDSSGRNVGLLLVCRDVSERVRAEREQKKLLDIIENSLNEIYLFDAVTLKFEYVNQGALRNIGYTLEELKELTPLAIKPKYSEAEFSELIKPLIRGEQDKLVFITVHKRKDGSEYPVEIHLQLFKQENKSVFFAVINDISERQRAEEQNRYQADLLQNVSDAIIATDQNYAIQIWNKAAEWIYGWKAEEVIGRILHEVLKPEYPYQSREEVVSQLEQEGAWSGEIVHHHRDGHTLSFLSSIKGLKSAGGDSLGMVSVNHDISERKQSEELIRASLKEKEVLLQEIHHRVKNNLQIISGLLTLQADQSVGKSIEDIFHESQDRIRSIALIHEKLYRSRNLAEIAFDEYLRTLTENLFISQGIVAGRITVKYELEPIQFTIEKAIPLGLIVNELLTNALKHAFPVGRQGEIRIELHGYQGAKSYALKTDSGTLHCVPTCELIVADDGVGLPAGQISEQQKTLGLNLVFMLAKQIQAELKVKTGPGTEFRLLFPGLPTNKVGKDKSHGG